MSQSDWPNFIEKKFEHLLRATSNFPLYIDTIKKKQMDIAIDFDGTCVSHEFPEVGKDIGAIPVLKKLIENGHNLILFTMRSGAHLESALQWFIENEIKLYGIQYNPTQTIWTSSNKCYAQLYIDDAALGCPLKQDWKGVYTGDKIHSDPTWTLKNKSVEQLVGRPYVDWNVVYDELLRLEIIK